MNPFQVLKFFPFFVFLFLTSITSFAQGETKDSVPNTWQLLKYDGISAFQGLTTTYAKPLEWEKEDYLTAGAIVLGTGAMFLIDENSTEWFMAQEEDIPNLIKEAGWYYGSPQNNYALNGAVYLYGLFTKNQKIRKTGVLLISAASTAGLLQTFSKTVAGRGRPTTGEGSASFKPFSNKGEYHSFPSGHTILSFTTAYAIGKQFNNPFIKAGIYGFGLVAPISRLWAGAHWFSDVGVSIIISVVVVDAIDNYLNKQRDYGSQIHDKNKISWSFQLGMGQMKVTEYFLMQVIK
ncbi:phosphatase PAP2 family protein [Antarcticibacterium sp. 1MA-6-2]|uniref:phosphatase PAP2 family protein n=1 Tax=Antarcticibacterium sp. 1MA-6-2 TaxID=2908210 RepID=UPI001F2411BB|nr:phosphatase PAP2 family protein [Antarcticibacterium sp. 1MA-6-2]UJH91957.1 phosphatase PAP2 family protein [Antarcticibacterium sp. 1MA-6-2]